MGQVESHSFSPPGEEDFQIKRLRPGIFELLPNRPISLACSGKLNFAERPSTIVLDPSFAAAFRMPSHISLAGNDSQMNCFSALFRQSNT